MLKSRDRREAEGIRAANPNENGPKFRIDPSDADVIFRIKEAHDSEKARWTKSAPYRAPEVMFADRDAYVHIILARLLIENEVNLWAICRELTTDDLTIGTGFEPACEFVRQIDGVQLDPPVA